MKELGFKQESLFYHSEQLGTIISREQFTSYDPYNVDKLQDDGFREAVDRTYSAYTVAELGEMLPKEIAGENEMRKRILNIEHCGDWVIRYGVYAFGELLETVYVQSAETEADARAKMLIYLAENNLINPKDIISN